MQCPEIMDSSVLFSVFLLFSLLRVSDFLHGLSASLLQCKELPTPPVSISLLGCMEDVLGAYNSGSLIWHTEVTVEVLDCADTSLLQEGAELEDMVTDTLTECDAVSLLLLMQ